MCGIKMLLFNLKCLWKRIRMCFMGRNLDGLFKDGYYLNDVSNGHVKSLAGFSLSNAMRAYFRTSVDLDYLRNAESINPSMTQEDKDKCHSGSYATDASDAITHYHHFLELYLKDILIKEHKLLVYDASKKPSILYKLVKGEIVGDDEIESLKMIEFSEAIDRITVLLRENRLDQRYAFLINYIDVMRRVNTLRNRITRRGAFILRSQALDEVFGLYLIPLAMQIVPISDFSTVLKWNFNLYNKNIDPYTSIVNEYQQACPNMLNVHLMKLVGNAAYNNEINPDWDGILHQFNKEKREKAEKMAGAEEHYLQGDRTRCPVCGCETLVSVTDAYEETDEKDNTIGLQPYVESIHCHQCGFEVKSWLLNKIRSGSILFNYIPQGFI